jgi:hypothetical protein
MHGLQAALSMLESTGFYDPLLSLCYFKIGEAVSDSSPTIYKAINPDLREKRAILAKLSLLALN